MLTLSFYFQTKTDKDESIDVIRRPSLPIQLEQVEAHWQDDQPTAAAAAAATSRAHSHQLDAVQEAIVHYNGGEHTNDDQEDMV